MKTLEQAEIKLEPFANDWIHSKAVEILGEQYKTQVQKKGIKRIFEEGVRQRLYENIYEVRDYVDTIEDFESLDDIRYEIAKESVTRKETSHRKEPKLDFYELASEQDHHRDFGVTNVQVRSKFGGSKPASADSEGK